MGNHSNSTTGTVRSANVRWRLAMGVLIFAWAYALWQLAMHNSRDPVIGRYSLPLFAAIVGWAVLVVPLLYFFIRPALFMYVADRVLTWIQAKAWRALPAIVALLVVIYLALNSVRLIDNWPGMQPLFVLGPYALIAVIVLYGWRRTQPAPPWRKLTLGVGLAIIALEVVLQGVAFAGALPSSFSSDAGLFKPYGRLLVSPHEPGLHMTNRYGFNAVAYDAEPNDRKIVLLGDEFIFSSETARDDQLAAHLESLIEAGGEPAAVMAMGVPGFGPAHYYEGIKNTIDLVRPNDIVVFINARDDFANNMPQVDPRTPQQTVFYTIDDDGFWNIHESSLMAQHLLWHDFVGPHTPPSHMVLGSLRSHLLTPKLIGHLVNGPTVSAETTPDASTLASLGMGRFAFEQEPEPNSLADKSIRLTGNLMEIASQVSQASGATLHVVFVPAFSDEFFAASTGNEWTTTFEGYDLLAPERQLAALTAESGLDLLAAGAALQEAGVTAEQLQGWYDADGMAFSADGERAFAQLVYERFFAP